MCDWWDNPGYGGGANLMDAYVPPTGLPPPLLQGPSRQQWLSDPAAYDQARSLFRSSPRTFMGNQGYQCPELLDMDPCAPSAPPVGTPAAYYPGIASPNWNYLGPPRPIPEELLRRTPEDGTPYGTPPGFYTMGGFQYPLSGSGSLRPDPEQMRDLLQAQISAPFESAAWRNAKVRRDELVGYHQAKAARSRRRELFPSEGVSRRRRAVPQDGMLAVRIQQAIEDSMVQADVPAHMSADGASGSTCTGEVRDRFIESAINNVQDALRQQGIEVPDDACQPEPTCPAGPTFFRGLQPSRPYSPEAPAMSPETGRLYREGMMKELENILEQTIGRVKLKKGGEAQIIIGTPEGSAGSECTLSSTTPTPKREIRFQRQTQANILWWLHEKGLDVPVHPDETEEDMEAIAYLTEVEGYTYEPKAHGSTWRYPPMGILRAPPEDEYLTSSSDSDITACSDCADMSCAGHRTPIRPRPREQTRFLNWVNTPPQQACPQNLDEMERHLRSLGVEIPDDDCASPILRPGAGNKTFTVPRGSPCGMGDQGDLKVWKSPPRGECPGDMDYDFGYDLFGEQAQFDQMLGGDAQTDCWEPADGCELPELSTRRGYDVRGCNLLSDLHGIGEPLSADIFEQMYLMNVQEPDVLRAPPSPCRSPTVEAVTPPRRRALHELPSHRMPGAESFRPMALGDELFSSNLRPGIRKGPMKSMLPSGPCPSGSRRRMTIGSPLAQSSPMTSPTLPPVPAPCVSSPRRSSLTELPAHRMPGYQPQCQPMATAGNVFTGGLRSGLNKGPTMLSGRRAVPGPKCPAPAPRRTAAPSCAPSRGLHELPAHRRPGAQPDCTSMANALAGHARGLRSDIYKRTSAPKPLMRKKPC
uniref:Uncharacterized protein n=1 Tax=Lygus hesperus TaxID=30085 RepID=A0A0A9WCV5_LYGHE